MNITEFVTSRVRNVINRSHVAFSSQSLQIIQKILSSSKASEQ